MNSRGFEKKQLFMQERKKESDTKLERNGGFDLLNSEENSRRNEIKKKKKRMNLVKN